jgi:hypothetical protein
MASVEKTFETPKGTVKVGLFEGGVKWNLDGDGGSTPRLFPWVLDSRKINKMGLTDEERRELDFEYMSWCADVGCGMCDKTSTHCSGLSPKFTNGAKITDVFEGKMKSVQNNNTHKEVAKKLEKSVCDAKYWG